MKRTIAAVLVILCVARLVCAQIGESKEQLSARYGQCVPLKDAVLPTAVIDDGCWFDSNGFKIFVHYKENKAVKIRYIKTAESTKRGKTKMSEDEINSLLRNSVNKPDWILISDDGYVRRWRNGDSSMVAYYFTGNGQPTQWWGPLYALLIQTASVDAADDFTHHRQH